MKGTKKGRSKKFIIPVVVLLALAMGFASAGFWFTTVAGRTTEVAAVNASSDGSYRAIPTDYSAGSVNNATGLSTLQNLQGAFRSVAAQALPTVVEIDVVDVIKQQRGKDAALSFLKQHLHDNPSLRGLARLIEMDEDTGDQGARDILGLLKDTVAQVLEEKPVYQCTHCGFAGKVMHWHCPGCKRWDTVKPILGLEGE